MRVSSLIGDCELCLFARQCSQALGSTSTMGEADWRKQRHNDSLGTMPRALTTDKYGESGKPMSKYSVAPSADLSSYAYITVAAPSSSKTPRDPGLGIQHQQHLQ